jgi:hypothetical protein
MDKAREGILKYWKFRKLYSVLYLVGQDIASTAKSKIFLLDFCILFSFMI